MRNRRSVNVKESVKSKSVSWIWYLIGVLIILAAAYFIFSGMTGKVVDGLNYDSGCLAIWNGSNFSGFADARGFVATKAIYKTNSVLKNNSFICFAGNFYYCGEGNETFAPRTTNGKIIGNWVCNMSNANWVASTSSISSIVEKNGRCVAKTSVGIAWTANGNIARDLDDPLILAKGGKFLCYNNYYYECGWGGKDYSVAFEAQNKTFVGGYVCDLTRKKWVSAKDNEMVGVPSLELSSCIDSSWGDGYNRLARDNSTVLRRFSGVFTRAVEDGSFTPSGSILCSDSSFYSCGVWSFSDKLAYNNAPSFNRSEFARAIPNQSFVGGWKCDVSQRKWVYEGSTISITSSPDECGYNVECSGFGFRGSPNSNYTINWTYMFADGYTEVVSQLGKFGNNGESGFSMKFNNTISDKAKKRIISSINYTVFDDRGSSVKRSLVVNYAGCSNECLVLSSKNCTGVTQTQYKNCIQSGTSACFKLDSNIGNCAQGDICDQTQRACVPSEGTTITCVGNNNMFCSSQSFIAGIATGKLVNRSTQSCGSSNFSCYECNASKGYSINDEKDNCDKLDCSKTCLTSNGICNSSASNLANAAINNTFECCDLESNCHVCSTGYHPFNGTCVSNNCTGIQPTGTNFTKGANTSLTGNNTWNYNATLRGGAALTCQWGCDVGFRIDLANNNSCVAGDPTCSEVGGVCLTALGNSITIAFGNCTSGGTCSQCNTEYGFNGTACVKSYCESGKIWNGFECTIDTIDGVCASGCKYNGNCIGNGIRIDASAKRYYCPLSGSAFVEAKTNGVACSSNFECQKNLCGKSGKCTDIVSELQSNVNFIGGAVCKLRALFRLETEDICLTRYQVSP